MPASEVRRGRHSGLISKPPEVADVAWWVAAARMFGFVLDVPEGATGGRHVWINPTGEGLLTDVREWLEERRGPSTKDFIRAVTGAIKPLKRGEIAHRVVTRFNE
jgi:hypothetical protein